MNILYIGSVCSKKMMAQIFAEAYVKPSLCSQKYHKLIIDGLVMNGACVDVLSARPAATHIWYKKIKDVEDNIHYNYLSYFNVKFLRQLCLFFGAFFEALAWCRKTKDKDRVIICDVLNISVAMATHFAAKISHVKSAGISTDLLSLICTDHAKKPTILQTLSKRFINLYLSKYDYYINITAAINAFVNPLNRPSIVIEGLVDINMQATQHITHKNDIKNIIYSGGIYEIYGVRQLIDAFYILPFDNVRLSIYGTGDMVADMDELCQRDHRLTYYGMVPNEQVVAAQLRACLLINPRPSHEEYTKYSFPSKNMEYMVSGTATVTTALPGMPPEYYDYVYIFDNECVAGYHHTLMKLLTVPIEELEAKGADAKSFVLKAKNNKIQASKILQLVASPLCV